MPFAQILIWQADINLLASDFLAGNFMAGFLEQIQNDDDFPFLPQKISRLHQADHISRFRVKHVQQDLRIFLGLVL